MRRHEHVAEQVAGLAEAIGYGRPRRVERITASTKKGVYRVRWQEGRSLIAYVWHPNENYWPDRADLPDASFFEGAEGLAAHIAATEQLALLGVPTPALVWVDSSRAVIDGEVAFVEEATGGPLLDHLSSERAPAVLQQLREALDRLHGRTETHIGTLTGSRLSGSGVCEDMILRRAVRDLNDAASELPDIAAHLDALADRLQELHAAIAPRQRYALIHGELGPEHVLLTSDGSPTLIDIEGLMFFDLEWEHVFLELRYGRLYDLLRPESAELDAARLAFYRLALHLSLCAGPMRLLRGDFPHREGMLAIVSANVTRVVGSLAQ